MAQLTSKCIFILVICGLNQGVVGRGPKMILGEGMHYIPDKDELYIQEGDDLRIECQSEGNEIKFSTQTLTIKHTRLESTLPRDSDSDIYTYLLKNTTSADTGWYACAEEGIEYENDEQTMDHPKKDISWIYVYVNSPNPFAIMDTQYEIIPAVMGSTVVIPCRITSPTLRPILIDEQSAGGEPLKYEYNPKLGFIMRKVGVADHSRIFKCMLDGAVEDEDDTWPMYVLDVRALTQMLHPIISQGYYDLARGEDLTLDCTIKVPVGTPVTLDWTGPVGRPRWPTKRIPLNKDSNNEEFMMQLTAKNMQERDSGEYICTAKDPYSNTEGRASTRVAVWAPGHTGHINVTIERNNYSISVSKRVTARWKIVIDTYPKEFKWKWFKQDGTLLGSSDMIPQGKYSHDQTGKVHWFRISETDIEDNGIYRLQIRTSYKNESIRLPLTVTGRPQDTKILKISSSYAPQQLAIFSCHTIGSPPPNITWIYMEYPNFPSKEISVSKSFSDLRNEMTNESPFHLSSHLNVTLNKTGELICRACNELGCDENVQHITISDAPGSLGISGPEFVIEGDNVNLTCSAARLNFTDLQWVRPDSNETLNSENLRLFDVGTNLTMGWILEIRNVSTSDAGSYSCSAEHKKTGQKMKEYELHVLEASEPRIVKSNMNDSKIFIKHSDINKNRTLICKADGVPTPRVTWYKDEILLKGDSNQYKLLDNNSTLHIIFFQETDHGRYSCRVENRLNYAERFVDIKIGEREQSLSISVWISLICVLILVIVIVIVYMIVKVRQEKHLRKELLDAGLTHFREGAIESLNPELTLDEQAELLPYDKKWEFPREQLKLGKQLGSGAFGVVMKAEARGICGEEEVTTVAVKMVRRTADPSYMKALSSELKIMIHLGRHINVVNLLGACTKTIMTKRELLVIVEYCRFGNLHNYLQRHRDTFIDQIDSATQEIDLSIGSEYLNPSKSVVSNSRTQKSRSGVLPFSGSGGTSSCSNNEGIQLVDFRTASDSGDVSMSPEGVVLSNNSSQPGWRSNYRGDYKDQNMKPICTQDLLCWAWQVARGMEYLSSRNVLHGDLAARNILLADDNIVKICDFGLAKNMYKDNNYKKKGDGPLPIKWMAIESIRDRIFSTQSDVWSYGIVLWEFFTLARSPYPGMEAVNQYDRLIEGYRMEKPEYATDEIYDFMLQCWKAEPSTRPSFSKIVQTIGNFLDEGVKGHYFDLNAPYMNMNAVVQKNLQSDYLAMMSAPNHTHCSSPSAAAGVHNDSGYVSMNQFKKSSPLSAQTPGSTRVESHFEFPPSDHPDLVNSDSRNDEGDSPIVNTANPYIKPMNREPVRIEIPNDAEEEIADENKAEHYSNGKKPQYSNLGNLRSSVVTYNPHPTPTPRARKLQMNNIGDPPQRVMNRYENRPDISQRKSSYNNPSYVNMVNNRS